jgi:hypothetical protein
MLTEVTEDRAERVRDDRVEWAVEDRRKRLWDGRADG